jgi:hypothetical protein
MAAAGTLGAIALAASGVAVSAAPTISTISITTNQREVQGLAPFQVSGAVASGRPGEDVTIEVKECGSYAPFHASGGTQTGNGGTWIAQIALLSTSQVRARWREGVSESVSVRVHPYMTITLRGRNRYFVWIRANDFFNGRRATLQRLSGNKWVKVRTFLLRRADSGGTVVSSNGTVRAKLKKGTVIRAVLPKSQAGRCYLAGFTNTLKV